MFILFIKVCSTTRAIFECIFQIRSPHNTMAYQIIFCIMTRCVLLHCSLSISRYPRTFIVGLICSANRSMDKLSTVISPLSQNITVFGETFLHVICLSCVTTPRDRLIRCLAKLLTAAEDDLQRCELTDAQQGLMFYESVISE